MTLNFEKLTKENYSTILSIKHKLFPESKSDEDYEKSFNQTQVCEYFLVELDSIPCGITGWYDFDNNNQDAFMGWFGVLPEFRKKGIGRKILDFTIHRVEIHKYNYFRVYTYKVINVDSVKLYAKANLIQENYTYPDKLGQSGNFVVFTKIINSNSHDLWKNRPLNEDSNYDF